VKCGSSECIKSLHFVIFAVILYKMKNRFFFLLVFFLVVENSAFSASLPGLTANIYDVMQSGDSAKINSALAELEKSTVKEKDAYKGTLLMQKSGMLKSGMDKLSVFKQGRKLLEGSIKLDSSNVEYRFLRLMIQEQAPDFLNYHSKKEEDAKMIRQSFATLPLPLKEAIKKYSKNSHVLKPEEFQK